MKIPPYVEIELGPVLAKAGFARNRRGEFDLRTEDGLAAIAFRRSRFNRGESPLIFSADIGFTSRRLSAVFGPAEPGRLADRSVHWFRWVGFIDPQDRHAEWWEVDEESPSSVRLVAIELRDRIIPGLVRRATDRGLRDDWLTEPDPWLGRPAQLARLAILVQADGPADMLPRIKDQVLAHAQDGSHDCRSAATALGW